VRRPRAPKLDRLGAEPKAVAGTVSRTSDARHVTPALIDEFLATDPEFARMTAKFHRLFVERASESGDVTAERSRLERAEVRRVSPDLGHVHYRVRSGSSLPVRARPGPRTAIRRDVFLAAVFGTVALGSALSWIVARMRPV